MKILEKKFYQRPTLDVARDLLGCVIVRKIGKKEMRAMITDVEAYIGEDDLACHASKGRTKRSEVLYGEAGHAYVYLIYGMYHIMNVVTEEKDFPAAVMIRAVKMEGTDYVRTNGPGKVCRALQIGKELHGWDMTKGERLWIEKRTASISAEDIVADRRVGIDYAKHCKEYPWRFALGNHPKKK